MRIALVSREYPPTRQAGGIATYTEKTARALAAAGHEVDVISEAHPEAPADSEEGTLRVRRLPDPGARPRELKVLRRAFDVAAALRRHGPYDLVQACEWEGEAAVFAARPTAPLVTRLATPHFVVERVNGKSASEWRRSLVVRRLERWQARRSAQVICPSGALADVVARGWRLDRERIEIVPTGIRLPALDGDVRLPSALEGRAYALYFGRLEVRKGVKTWIDALPAVLDRHPDLLAAFAGDDLGLGGVSFREYAGQRLGPRADRLVFLPRLPQAQLFPILARAHLVVLPSLWESLANACLEAMAFGRPVVSTTGSGFAEVIAHGETGFLAPPGDAAALADVTLAALADPERLRRVGAAARRRAGDYDLDLMVKRLAEVHRRVVDAHGGRTEELVHGRLR